METYIKNIRKDFFCLLNDYPQAKCLIEELQKIGELLLFGGAVREYLDSRFDTIPRDFDIVINKKSRNFNLEDIFKKFSYKKNRFGGYKIIVNSLEFDVWELEDTWAFKEQKLKCNKQDYSNKLQDTVFLNIDSIVYNLTTNKMYNSKYKYAMNNKQLDVVLEENPFKELNMIRAMVFKEKYEMNFSQDLKKIFKIFIETNDDYLEKLYQAQYKHYNMYKIDKIKIKEGLEELLNSH